MVSVEVDTVPRAKRLRTPLRYMGTKRSLAQLVRKEVDNLQPRGRVADLFAGLGSVAQSMAPAFPVLVNDGLAFTGAFAKARFLEPTTPRTDIHRLCELLYLNYAARIKSLTFRFEERIEEEFSALHDGPKALMSYLERVEHVGNSRGFWERARSAGGRKDAGHYCLVSLYYSGGYFSTRQAVALDALRYAIDYYDPSSDWLLAAWLATAGAVINAPGHTAQYLKPTSSATFHRIRRQWKRSIWPIFMAKLDELAPAGDRRWRMRNEVTQQDALALLGSGSFEGVGMIYADPPYTKDQYSRYYHVYETLYLYDYPDSSGLGRYRSGRFTSLFSLASQVESAFADFFCKVADLQIPLVLSYPERSLLSRRGVEIRDVISSYFELRAERAVQYQHSTLGASKGKSHLAAREQIFVCIPRKRNNLRGV